MTQIHSISVAAQLALLESVVFTAWSVRYAIKKKEYWILYFTPFWIFIAAFMIYAIIKVDFR